MLHEQPRTFQRLLMQLYKNMKWEADRTRNLKMERQLREFYDRGYMRIENALPTLIAEQALEAAGSLKYVGIFKDAIGDLQIDPHRAQGSFPSTTPFKQLKSSMYELIRSYNMGWAPKNWVVIWSKAGGEEQAPHQDFPKREITHARAGIGFKGNKEVQIRPTIQAGIIVALMPNTKLIVYDRCFNDADLSKKREIALDVGECIIFRGDLVHAGAAFDENNWRVHATLTIPEVPWDSNATEAVALKEHKCNFCPMRTYTAGAIHAHMQYCKANPDCENHLKAKRKLNQRPKTCARCGRVCATRSIYYKHKCSNKN
jgi:hypothetical protein